MKRAEGIAYLEQDGGAVPCSRYGRNSKECAPVAWRFAYVYAKCIGEPVDIAGLDYAMSLVVNDSDEVSYLIRNYGGGHYR